MAVSPVGFSRIATNLDAPQYKRERRSGKIAARQARQSISEASENPLEVTDNEAVLKDLGVPKMLRCQLRHFADGPAIGSKKSVNEVFPIARERFGAKR